MFKRLLRGVVNMVERSVKIVEDKVDEFVNKDAKDLDNIGNCLAIMGPAIGFGVGIAAGIIGVGIKTFANTKK